MGRFRQLSFWVIVFGSIGGVIGLTAGGFFFGQWSAREYVAQANKDKDQANATRDALIARFPVVRKEAYQAGVDASAAKMASLQKQIDDFGDMKAMVTDAHEIVAYTLRFLGKRAEISDRRTAELLKQTRAATANAADTKQVLEKVDKKITEQAAKVDAAASAVQQVEKKLAPPPAPPQQSKGWFGFGGH